MIPRKRIVRRTEPLKDPVRQANLLFDEQKEVRVEETSNTIMQGVLYDKMPGMFSKEVYSKDRYFFYDNYLYRKIVEKSTDKKWVGESPDRSSTLKICSADPEKCYRLSKYNPLLVIYDFILNQSKYKTRTMEESVMLYKIEHMIRLEVMDETA